LRVFLSFHSPDRAIALGLKDAIEAALPGVEVFVDQRSLRYGHFWQPALSDAIAEAQAFLILVSARVGDWQRLEYYEARDRKARDDTFVLLPVIIADRAKGPAANLPGLPQLHWIESTEPTAPAPLAKIVAALKNPNEPKPPEPWRAMNPYRGLVALEEQDSDFFFGRDRETADIIGRIIVAPGRLITLVGNSGVGKSSLMQAGVIASLKRQRWAAGGHAWPQALKDSRAFAYLTMKPGEDPIDEFMSAFTALWFPDPTDPKRVDRRWQWAERLRQGNARFADVIKATDDHLRNELALTPPPRFFFYIDQGEELYARAPPAERKRFSEIIADGLAQSSQRLIIMTSQRADYYGELQANAALFKLTEKVDVPPLEADALALVLREPARVLGVAFESEGLVDHVVKSAEDQPGALPLLADLFTDLWERMRGRGDGTLRVSDRPEIIQVGAALARRADLFLASVPDKVEAVKRLFTLRLVHVPPQGEPVRARWERPAKQAADTAIDAEWALIEELAGPNWRLIVTGERHGKATAEVAHEILLKAWPRLREWIDASRDMLRTRSAVLQAKAEWELHDRREDLLLPAGFQLQRAQKLLAEPKMPADDIQEFVVLSSEREARQAAYEGEIEARTRANILAEVAWTKLREGQLDSALRLAACGARIDYGLPQDFFKTSQAAGALASAISQADWSLRLTGHDSAVYSAVFSPDGSRIVTASQDNTARTWDAATGEEIAVLRGHQGSVNSAAFNSDGSRIVTASADSTARIWDTVKTESTAVLRGHTDMINTAAFSPDGSRIVTSSSDNTARVWKVATAKQIAILRTHGDTVCSAAFSPDGSRIVTAARDGTARLWDATTAREIAVLHHDNPLASAAFGSDGSLVVTALEDSTARIWRLEDSSRTAGCFGWRRLALRRATIVNEIAVLHGHREPIRCATFSSDSSLIVTASGDQTVRIWDAATGIGVAVLRGHDSSVHSVAFGPDGRRIITASDDGSARIWKIPNLIAVLSGHDDTVSSAAYSPDGSRIVTGSWDRTACIWAAQTAERIAVLSGHGGPVRAAAFSPDGSRIVTASDDKTVRVWDSAAAKGIAILRGHDHTVCSAAFSADGKRVVTASRDDTVRIWDVETANEITVMRSHQGSVNTAAFSSDGLRIVTASDDKTARVWDGASAREIGVFRHDAPVSCAAFGSNDSLIVTASDDRVMRIWEVATAKEIAVLRGHEGTISSASFNRGGSHIVTASSDDCARIWDAATAKQIALLRGHGSTVTSAAFNPDGTRIVTSSSDNTARVWDAHFRTPSMKGLLAEATARLGGVTKLTDEEMRLAGYSGGTSAVDVRQV
jgi:WD40 repeat protein